MITRNRLGLIPTFLVTLFAACTDPLTSPAPHAASQNVAPPLSAGISFVGLRPDQEIRVRYASEGCFHKLEAELLVSQADATRPTQLTLKNWRANVAPEWRYTASPTLDSKQLRALDGLLAYYRSLQNTGGCTTTEHVEVALHRGGQRVAVERYKDGTCGLIDTPDVLPFGALLDLVRPDGEALRNYLGSTP